MPKAKRFSVKSQNFSSLSGADRPPNEHSHSYVSWNWVEGLLLGLLALVGADLLIGILAGLAQGILDQSVYARWINVILESDSVTANFIYYSAARLAGFALIVTFIRRRKISLRQFGFKKFKPVQAVGLLLVSSAILIVAIVGIYSIVDRLIPGVNLEQSQENVFGSPRGPIEIGLSFLALVVIAPIVEESIFRGLMLPAFARSFGKVAAVFITALLFGAIHWQLNVGIVTFFMGLLMGWMYYKTRSLVPGILFHSLKNLVAFISIF